MMMTMLAVTMDMQDDTKTMLLASMRTQAGAKEEVISAIKQHRRGKVKESLT